MGQEQAPSSVMFAPKFKAKAPLGTGIWTPKSQATSLNDLNEKTIPPTPPPAPGRPIWTPQPSPASERKEFRPVRFESPTLPRRYVVQPQSTPSDGTQPPWSQTSNSCTNLSSTPTSIHSGEQSVPLNICRTSRGVSDKIKTFERSASASEIQQFSGHRYQDTSRAIYKPNEVIYKIKHEYMSEPETETDYPRKMAKLGRRQFDGIGPVTNDGMPIILRSEVQEPHQHEWYKRLYQTIHKQKHGGRPQFKSNGYQSEPEPSYDSDYTTVKYRTLDRRRQQFLPSTAHVRNVANTRQDDNLYGTMPNPIKSGQISYKNQPGRIEDYVTGHSSVSEKEKKEWWDEVMDIFNGWLRDNTKKPCIIIEFVNDENEITHLDQTKLASQHYTEGNLSRALNKESGYTSDSNIVFRKKEVPQGSPLSPVEQKQAYKSLQAGGEPPLFGFRKAAPEKPRGIVEEFEYFQITPTLTKIRVTCKDIDEHDVAEIRSQEPATDNKMSHTKRMETHFDMYTPFPKNLPSFIPLSQKKEPPPPPLPPHRRSSCTKASRKVSPERGVVSKTASSKISHRHEQCFQSPNESVLGANKYGTITLRKTGRREPICRSKSTGAVSTLLSSLVSMKDTKTTERDNVRTTVRQQHIRLGSVSPTRRQPRIMSLRQSSRSPVAFGRSISKERTFAEEKKRLENTLPLSRATFKASTNILRDPSLKSPQDVKHAMRSYATCSAQIPPPPRSKSLPRTRASSTTVNTTMRHTMCFPRVHQTKVVECYRPTAVPIQKSTASVKTYTPVKTDQKLSTKTGTKSVSTVSLPRSNSTFSVESTSHVTISKDKILSSTAKLASKIKNCTKKNKEPKSKSVALQNSKSDGNLGRKTNRFFDNIGQKKERKVSSTVAPIKPDSLQEMHASHYFREIVPSSANDNKYYCESSIRDKAMLWNDLNSHNTKSLTHQAPTLPLPPTQSKYISSYHKSRSLSPNRQQQLSKKYVEDFYTKYDDYESEFGETSCIEDLVWQYEQQGRKESCSKSPHTVVHNISRPESPTSSYSSYRDNRKFSPTREVRVPQTPRNVRSPSRRKIDSCRTNLSKNEATSKVVRASSLSSADDRSKRGLYLCGELAHSATSLTYLDRHSPTCRYRNNSERFADLNRFYNTLERVGQLERATSVTNFKPIRKDTELLDFDEWRKIRLHERAEKELNYLVNKLKQDQREKDLVFRPKDVDDVKWRKETDFGLFSREKSVEDLRDGFERNRLLKDYENISVQREYYRPYWRRNTVADLASSLEVQLKPESSTPAPIPKAPALVKEPNEIHLSNRLVSTLSKEQVLKISQQLNDIYSSNSKGDTSAVSEEYIVTVDNKSKPIPSSNSLKVRCNSSITKEELLGPIMRKKVEQANALNIRHNKSLDYQKLDMTDTKDRVYNRGNSPVYLARETRGAVAAKNAESTLPRHSDVVIRAEQDLGKKDGLKHKPETDLLPRSDSTSKQFNNILSSNGEDFVYEDYNRNELSSLGATIKPTEKITQKIQFFEDRQFEEPPKTIYHAREDSSPDENEVMRVIEENRLKRGFHKHKELSSSLTNLKDIFGETNSSRVNFHLHSPPQRPPDEFDGRPQITNVSKEINYEIEDASLNDSINAYDTYYHRSRSFSPPPSQTSSSYLHRVHTGEVQKIKEKFESISDDTYDKKHFFGLNSLRKVRSDPELIPISSESKDTFKTLVNFDEYGDVSWITHKFEVRNSNEERGRRRNRINISPTNSLKNRLMPHIDIISKTAALKRELHTKSPIKHYSPTRSDSSNSGAVDRIRCQYESISSPADATKYLSSSNPDLRDVNTISRHLTANWIAHKYPSPKQNTYSGRGYLKQIRRPSSTSPPRPPKSSRHAKRNISTVTITSSNNNDIFANQKFNPKIHQPKARYVPDGAEVSDWKKVSVPATCSGNCDVLKKSMAVTFEDYDFVPPVPPQPYTKNVSLDQNGNCSESPTSRYHESDVNIHFKTPIRHEYKNPLSEEELTIRQSEQMQKLYQEERRRKYLQELQDMNSRRHTDNFTPSQKSPIPLNRYDDFPADLVPKTSNTAMYPKAVARALYNFQGQSARELSFKKGDLIYIRRVIDKNWYEGEYNAMIGLLPVNYVELINKDKVRQPAQQLQQQRKPSEGQARAKYHFQAQSGVELSLNKGELVTLTRKVDDNWFEGKIANRKGIFPVSYVEVLTDIGAEEIAAKTTVITTQSTTNLRPSLDTLRTNINNEFNIITQNGHQPPNGILKETRNTQKTDELHVDTSSEPLAYRALYKYRPQNSDELELMEGDIVHVLEKCDDGWFVGTSQSSGCFGTFPGNYVERV